MRKLFVLAAILSAACGGSSGDNTPPATPTAATPTFSVPAGTKNAPISVTISSTTPGAVVRYTTNGVDPTAASTTTQPVVISTATTLKAIATATGYNASAVATAAYTFQAATPTFSVAAGTYLTAQNVALSTVTPGATIHYTTDGTTPTASSAVYAAPISLATDPSDTTIQAVAVRAGFTDSGLASARYFINSAATPTATPTFSPPGATYAAVQDVTIGCTDAGATIYYTTDGSDPTVASSVYTAPVHVAASLTVKAIASAPNHTVSAIGSAAYVINLPQAAAPTFSPAAGTYTSVQNVVISTTTPGATIRYTTDGSTPTVSSAAYSAAVPVNATGTLKAFATAPGYTASTVASALYTINLPAAAATPTFSPAPGAVSSGQVVTISSTTPGAVIHCTTNGAAATAASPACTTVTVTAATTIRAVATATGYTTSAEATGAYTIGAPPATCGSGTDFMTVCGCVTEKIVDLMVSCTKMNPAFLAALGGVNDCAATQKEIDAGLMTYSASAGATCKADAAAMTCASLGAQGEVQIPASCATAGAGTVANGSGVANRCYSSDDCANGFCTSESTAACPGYCNAYATAGQDCTTAECAAGLGCDTSGATPVCVALGGAGGACPCQDGLYCDGTNVCRTPKTSGTCSVYLPECAVGYGCFAPTPPSGTCAPLAGLGDPCTANPCGLGYYCSSGTCAAAKPGGAACGASGYTPECMSFVCVSGFCQALTPDAVCTMP